MVTLRKFVNLLLLLCVGGVLPGCGQKSDLYLPDAGTEQTQADERSSGNR